MKLPLFHILFSNFAFLICDSIENPEDFVNLLSGTFTDGRQFSSGNTLPLVGLPWGFNHWAPQTKEGSKFTDSWWFSGNAHEFTWLRCTHQPSPWIGDWGWFLFGPQIGNAERNPISFWEPRSAIIKPHIFVATLAPYGIRIELVPTMHGSILRTTFPADTNIGEKRICFREAEWTGHADKGNNEGFNPWITGISTQVHIDRLIVGNFQLHIRIESDIESRSNIENHGDMVCFRYPDALTVATVRIATSLISFQQAKLNMNSELDAKKSFEVLANEAKTTWNKMLRRVDVIDPGELTSSNTKHIITFYSGLARALAFPRRLDEIDASGKLVHYSPYDPAGKVYPGPLVTDNGFWDTFRTVYPLLALGYPEYLGVIIEGWLNAYREGGWLPSWASPGYRNCMVGTYADVVVSDAIVKDIPGFSLQTAIEALKKDSFENPPKFSGGAVGKDGLQDYNNHGYIPSGPADSVSRTLDFGFADYSIAQAFLKIANVLNNNNNNNNDMSAQGVELKEYANKLLVRSERAVRSLFDSNSGLMMAKTREGQFNRIDPITWGNGYTEGNAWHHSFPPYALSTLISLYGSKSKVLNKLHQLLNMPSNFRVGSYGQEIHEMTEMRALAMGQYGHNNQPCHHILYLFALLGDRATTEVLVRQVLDRAYGIDYFAGDEDNGEQGSWFVLSALGLFSAVPGSSDYVLGSPLFRHVAITSSHTETSMKISNGFPFILSKIENKNSLDIIALGTKEDVVRVNSVLFNQQLIDTPTIDYHLLKLGGTLRFIMAGEETENGSPPLTQNEINLMRMKPLELTHEIIEKQSIIEILKIQLQRRQGELHSIQEKLISLQSKHANATLSLLPLSPFHFQYHSTPTFKTHSTGMMVLIGILILILIVRIMLVTVVREVICFRSKLGYLCYFLFGDCSPCVPVGGTGRTIYTKKIAAHTV